jgi:hypothetical protein
MVPWVVRHARPRRSASALVILGACGLLAACGGDGDDAADPDAAPDTVDVGGVYEVTTALAGDCDDPEAMVDPPTHIWMEPFDDIFYLRYCSGTDTGSDCYATPFYDFTAPLADGWSSGGGSAAYSGQCTLAWTDATVTLTGDALRVEARSVLLIDDRAEADCTLAAADALTSPCSSVTEIDATAI